MGAASKRKRLLEIARTIRFPFTAISWLAESMKASGRKAEESQILWQPYFPPPTGMPVSLGFSSSLAPSKNIPTYLF